MAKRWIGNDVAKVYASATAKAAVETLFWGDEVDFLRSEGGRSVIKFRTRDKHGVESTIDAYLAKGTTFTTERPLIVRFVDVGQGDGAIVETPKGRLMVVDGGEGEHLRRYMRTAFRNKTIPIEVIVATHGDADHYSGLTSLVEERNGERAVAVTRVFHNGLVKRPGKKKDGAARKDAEMFGKTRAKDGDTFCTELVDDIRTVEDAEMNEPFQAWKAALTGAKGKDGTKTKMKRLALGDTIEQFVDEGVRVDVIGPVVEEIAGGPALQFLHETPGSKSLSASHTVNGHSVVLLLTYGNVRFLFAADLNEESEELLLSTCRDRGIALTAEVLKVPHHGSADFSMAMLQAVSPVVSVVSSGDESTRTEYIHPRAGLVGALGRASRASADPPLVYVTEMVAFMERVPEKDVELAEKAGIKSPQRLYRKLQFGIVHVRTDGERLLVVVPSGKEDFVEAYAYEIDKKGLATRAEVR